MKTLLTLMFAMSTLVAVAATDPLEAYQKVKEGKAVLVDVREAEEIKSGIVEGALWFPTSRFSSGEEWKKDFKKLTGGKEIFLYCRTGNRSGKIQNILKENNIESHNLGGYENLKEVLPTEVPKEVKP